MVDTNLRIKLESGASRVFNCLQLTRGLRDQSETTGQGDVPVADLFFGSRTLNHAILIKEPNLGGERGRDPFEMPLPIRTKLFIPYNAENPYEGGESSYTDDPQFEEALSYLTGAGGENPETFRRDLEKIRLLEQLPSLDPFLLKDKFALSGMPVNEAYFRLSEEEWRNIRAHIRERFVLMCRFATASQGEVSADVVDRLVDRIWEARDLEPLYPLLSAFGLPTDRATEFFYCWKGIGFFDYEFTRNTPLVRGFSSWIQGAQPRGAMHRDDAEAIEQDRAHVRGRMRAMLAETLGILQEFNGSFDQLFRRRETARNFSTFMLNARRHFWCLGNNLNGIYHVVSLWNRVTARAPERNLPPAQMVRLLKILRELV
jgi:hypothetical protein